jgi:hypothetical protein
LVLHVLPEAEAGKYSFKSYRSGFARAFLAACCPPAMIQALACWSSEDSLKVYARPNPSYYAVWITEASTQGADSTTTRHMPPLIDKYVIMESFLNADDIFKRADSRSSAS